MALLGGNSNPGRSEHVRNMFGTRCSEHVRNMDHVPNLWDHVPCQLRGRTISVWCRSMWGQVDMV